MTAWLMRKLHGPEDTELGVDFDVSRRGVYRMTLDSTLQTTLGHCPQVNVIQKPLGGQMDG
jgi:hypothetical protein